MFVYMLTSWTILYVDKHATKLITFSYLQINFDLFSIFAQGFFFGGRGIFFFYGSYNQRVYSFFFLVSILLGLNSKKKIKNIPMGRNEIFNAQLQFIWKIYCRMIWDYWLLEIFFFWFSFAFINLGSMNFIDDWKICRGSLFDFVSIGRKIMSTLFLFGIYFELRFRINFLKVYFSQGIIFIMKSWGISRIFFLRNNLII